jgi:hypothetical protein
VKKSAAAASPDKAGALAFKGCFANFRIARWLILCYI